MLEERKERKNLEMFVFVTECWKRIDRFVVRISKQRSLKQKEEEEVK